MKRTVLFSIAIFMMVSLCAFTIPGCNKDLPKPNNAQTAAWEGVAAYGIAAHVANQYLAAPECTNPITAIPCSKAAIRAQVRTADQHAYEAVKQAEAAIRANAANAAALAAAADKAVSDLNQTTKEHN